MLVDADDKARPIRFLHLLFDLITEPQIVEGNPMNLELQVK